jgi:hypothetical protein
MTMRARLTTSAAGFNRTPAFVVSDGNNDVAQSGANNILAVSSVGIYTSFPGAGASGSGNAGFIIESPTDGWVLLPGWSIRSSVASIDGGDQWDQVRLWVIEYPTGPTLRRTPDVGVIEELR